MFSSWVLFLSCLVILVRLFTFRRRGARYRPLVSTLAWSLMTLCAAVAIKLALNQFPLPVHPLMALASLVLAGLVILVEGNVAHLIRPRKPRNGY